MLPLGHVIHRHNVSFHPYADDTQLYLSFNHNDFKQINTLINCILDLKCWMAQNFLQLNTDKTEVIIIGPDTVSACTTKHLGSLYQNLVPNCKNLGVSFDNNLSLNKHVNAVVWSCFLQLRRLSRIS